MPCALHPEPSRTTACTCVASETPEQGRAVRIARLRRLADLGMRLAERVVAQAEADLVSTAADDPAPGAPDPTARFARIARVVHQVTALEERLANPSRASDAAPAPRADPADPADPAEPYEIPSDVLKQEEAADIVLALIAREHSPAAADRAVDDVNCEIETGYDPIDLTHRPLGEIAAEVAQAFVLRPDWTAWKGEPWVADAIRRWDELMGDDAEVAAQSP